MIQNLKIDIIYYDTPSDFEFEFNLGGCCHSRIINNKTSSPKEMIDCLSKAVGRSRVILVIGKLNGRDGLFNLISKAIGAPLSKVDANEYGIADGSDTTVIENSVPLVSTDGLLSGCIIESGPQAIVLLPGSKALRKDISDNLVFQYITAVSRTPDIEPTVTADHVEVPAAEDVTPEVQTKTPESEIELPAAVLNEEPEKTNETDAEIVLPEEVKPEAPAETEIEIPAEEPAPAKRVDNGDTLGIELTEIFERINNNGGSEPKDFEGEIGDSRVLDFSDYPNADGDDDGDDDDYDYDEDSDAEISNNSKGGINLFIWIILGIIFVIVAILIYMLVFIPLSGGVNIFDYIKQIMNA